MWHEDLLYKLFQRVVLNGENSSRSPVLSGVQQVQYTGPTSFLIYINDLPKELKSNAKLYADDNSLFTIASDKNKSANILNNDLLSIFEGCYNKKMLSNADTSKPFKKCYFREISIQP